MSVSVYCPFCHKYTALSLAPGIHGGECMWDDGHNNRWWIGVCNGCNHPVLVRGEGYDVYPSPIPTPTDPAIPQELAKDLDEAKMCFSVSCYRGCAAMARRCIQNACLEKGAKEKDLVRQISELTRLGTITRDIEEWATVVRWVGNDAAHPGKDPVTKEDAEDCLKLAEQFLHVIYVTPSIAKARRAARGK